MSARLTIKELEAALAAGTLTPNEIAALQQDPRRGVRELLKRREGASQRAAREQERLQDLTAFERRLWSKGATRVAGLDEVGAGTLAGPVVAAAVILPVGLTIEGIDDSKRLTRKQRDNLAEVIRAHALAWAIGSCSAQEIDRLNILQAGREAMRRAVVQLEPAADYLLVDARDVPAVGVRQLAIESGDRRSQSIAAASILAKVERDGHMLQWAQTYPGYGFEQHLGYSTAAHLEALRRLGPSPLHRRSFGPVKAVLAGMSPSKPKQLSLY